MSVRTVAVSPKAEQRWSVYLLVPLLLTTGVSGTYVAPAAVEGIAKQFALGATYSGGIVTFELVFSFFTALGLANHLDRMKVSRLVLWSCCAGSMAQLLSAQPIGLPGFLVCRAVVGLSCGVLYAVACFWAARHVHGVRVLSVAFIAASSIYGIGMTFWPSAVASYGLAALYLPLAALGVVVAFAVAILQEPARSDEGSSAVCVRPVDRSATWMLLAMCALANLGLQMIWTFTERTALSHGLPLETIGWIFGATAIFNVLGSLAASLLDRRIGVSWPLIIGLSGGALAGIFIGGANTVIMFAAGMSIYGIATFFVLPFLLSAGAHFDATGSTVTLASATVYLAGAVGPLLGGFVSDTLSPAAVGWIAASSCMLGAILARLLKPAVDWRSQDS